MTETSPKATLATFQLCNELKHCCCAVKTPAALKIMKEESRHVPLGCKRGYGLLPITVPIPFDILSTLAFPPVLQNSSCHKQLIFCIACHRMEGDRCGRRKHLLGIFSLPWLWGKDESLPDPGVRGHPLWGVTALFGPLAANPPWVALAKRFLYPLDWKKITTELTSPVKIHDSGKSSRIKWGVGGNIN